MMPGEGTKSVEDDALSGSCAFLERDLEKVGARKNWCIKRI